MYWRKQWQQSCITPSSGKHNTAGCAGVCACVRVCVCVCVCVWQGWVGKCVWWPSSSLDVGSSSSPPPSDLTQSCVTPCCYSKPENQLWRHYVCEMRLWKQRESYFIARITSVASQNNMCMSAVHEMPMVHTVHECVFSRGTLPSSGSMWYNLLHVLVAWFHSPTWLSSLKTATMAVK